MRLIALVFQEEGVPVRKIFFLRLMKRAISSFKIKICYNARKGVKMNTHLFPILLVFTLGVFLFSFNSNDMSSLKACIKVFDGGMQANGQHAIRFYNGCPTKVYINACVKDNEGESKLYQSPRSIPKNGNYTIWTFPYVIPSNVEWIAALFNPPIPGLCAKAQVKK